MTTMRDVRTPTLLLLLGALLAGCGSSSASRDMDPPSTSPARPTLPLLAVTNVPGIEHNEQALTRSAVDLRVS